MGTFRYVGTPALIARGRGAVAAALVESAEHLVGEAQDAAPYETGTLEGSIHAGGLEGSGNALSIKVQTGGESSEYAIYQHEGTSRGVPATKFLEVPLLENRKVYLEAIKRAARGAY